ncbi:MAG: outer membrane protein assembly factor BamD [Acidobacteria bacterium]|nr:outer membrane protein assembly factor BamD [Acidobacteriota bacterium]
MPAPRRWVAAAVVVVLAAFAAACGSSRTTIPSGVLEPDKLLFERGTVALNDRKWITSREYFRQLYDGYPQSPYRADAKLGLADTYLGEGSPQSFVLAINEFREFLAFYPTHQRADYAQFKLAMCHYYQMAKPERDQSATKEALREFDAFFERFPNSPLMDEVRQRHREARDRLSQSEFGVGLFYFRARWYPGAVDRLRSVLKDDPQYTNRDAVYHYLAESLIRMGRPAEALPLFEQLLQEFEQSEYLANAQKRVAELRASLELPPKTETPGTGS